MKRRPVRTVLFAVIVLLCGMPVLLAARVADHQFTVAERQKFEEFVMTADEFYRAALEQEFEQALAKLKLMEKQIGTLTFEGVTSLEGIEALVTAMVEAKKSLAAVKPDQAQIASKAAALRMAVDSLGHPPQPMWNQYERILRGDLEKMKRLLSEGEDASFKQAYDQFYFHFGMIRPAVIVHQGAAVAEQMKSLFAAMDRTLAAGAGGIDRVQAAKLLESLSGLLDQLFGTAERDAYLPLQEQDRPLYWILLLCILILAVLAFVAWQKYRGEKGYVSVGNPRPTHRERR